MGVCGKPKMTPVKRWLLLHNPSSRRGARVWQEVRSLLQAKGLDGENHLEEVPLGELGRVEDIPGRIIALGGDGTVNAAAEWLHAHEGSAPIAIVPAGTGNNLARGLGLPLRLDAALELAVRGERTRPLDAVEYQAGAETRKRLFVQTAAVGFPADIAARYDSLRRHRLFRLVCAPMGPFVYRALAFLGLAAQKAKEWTGGGLLDVECALPGERIREKVFAIFIGNERSLGGNFQPCPRAAVDDGALDICLVRAGTRESYLRLFRAVVRGDHLALERTVLYRQTAGPVEISLSEPRQFLADGDLWVRDSKLRLEVLPRRFQVITG